MSALDLDAVRRGAEQPTPASEATLEAAASDLSAAFHHDPILDWFMRADARRDQARQAFFRLIVCELAFPTGVIERPEAGGAAAIWVRSERLGPNPASQELRALPVLLGATGLRRFPRLLALRKAMDAHHPPEPHDYLWFLGVRPSVQGHGVGSRLLAAHCAALDAAGRAAWLETGTPRNLGLYRRYGFEIRAEYRPGPDGPLMWGMWRAAASGH